MKLKYMDMEVKGKTAPPPTKVKDGCGDFKIERTIPKSKLVIGYLTIYFDKKFNWFNRLMLRLVFGLDIKNVKDSD